MKKHDYIVISKGRDWALTRKCMNCGLVLIRDENYQHTFYGGTKDLDKCITRKIEQDDNKANLRSDMERLERN